MGWGGQCLGEGKRGEGRAGGKEGRRREGKRSKGRGGVDRGGEGKKWAEGNLNGDVAAARVYFKPTPWATLILDLFLHPVKSAIDQLLEDLG